MSKTIKITVIGAAGGIGQSLSMLIKTQLANLVDDGTKIHLALYDVAKEAMDGVYADLSHINTAVKLTNYAPSDMSDTTQLHAALKDASLVVIPAGVPRKPGMTRLDLLKINGKIIAGLTDAIAEVCNLSKVFVLVISNPVNVLVPLMIMRLKEAHFDRVKGTGIERRILGVTNLDLVRSSRFVSDVAGNDDLPYVPVIGGHSGTTIIPLFSQTKLSAGLSMDQLKELIHRVQFGGDEVVKAKNGKGSATLSMAWAAYLNIAMFTNLFLNKVKEINPINYISLKDLEGKPISANAESLMQKVDNCEYFSIPLKITLAGGIEDVDYDLLSRISNYERDEMIPVCTAELKKNIEIAAETVKQLD